MNMNVRSVSLQSETQAKFDEGWRYKNKGEIRLGVGCKGSVGGEGRRGCLDSGLDRGSVRRRADPLSQNGRSPQTDCGIFVNGK
ncbi:unnamed protein product [Pieris brassicae]|uniref:Uncharacterized protein n=1 Tax=Pieris brassicae TaxID=7116 RepID=A0A9P0TFJ5_PIEBR|nr:unnamed protein product [Pieris brassicae]